MDRRLEYCLLLIVCNTVLCSSNRPCLTWEIHQESLMLICRITNFTQPVSLVDSQGQVYVNCTFTGNAYNCTPVWRNNFIVVDYSRKKIVFTIPKLDTNMNGIWACTQDGLKLTTKVSLSNGIIDSAEIFMAGKLLNAQNESTKHIISCFSCREPDGNNVEILVNGRTEVSITYNHDTGQCTHHKGKCHPEECSCTENVYMQVFQPELNNNGTIYACDMLFTDSFTNAKFSTFSFLVFDGTGFSSKNQSISIIKAADKIWNGTFTADKEAEITAELDPTRKTPMNETTGNILEANKDELLIPLVIAIGIACGLGSLSVSIYFRQYYKRKGPTTHGIQENNVSTESTPLVDFQLSQPAMSSNTTDSRFCDGCSTKSKARSAVFVCIDCEKAMCAICFHCHTFNSETRNHKCFSTNKIPKNLIFNPMCIDNCSLTYNFLCVYHQHLCCYECIITNHSSKGCKVQTIEKLSMESEVFDDYETCVDKCLDLLVDLCTFQYRIIDQVEEQSAIQLCIDMLRNSSETLRSSYESEVDINAIKQKLNSYAKETCKILFITREQKELFEFMKNNGSKRQLFILTYSLKEKFNEIHKSVLGLVSKTKLAMNGELSHKDSAVTFPSIEIIERKVKNILKAPR